MAIKETKIAKKAARKEEREAKQAARQLAIDSVPNSITAV
jgi:hypothetical protein